MIGSGRLQNEGAFPRCERGSQTGPGSSLCCKHRRALEARLVFALREVLADQKLVLRSVGASCSRSPTEGCLLVGSLKKDPPSTPRRDHLSAPTKSTAERGAMSSITHGEGSRSAPRMWSGLCFGLRFPIAGLIRGSVCEAYPRLVRGERPSGPFTDGRPRRARQAIARNRSDAFQPNQRGGAGLGMKVGPIERHASSWNERKRCAADQPERWCRSRGEGWIHGADRTVEISG